MAERDKLELKIAVEDQELQESVESTKSLNKSYSELDSTILNLNNNTSVFSKYLKLVNNNTLTLNSSLFELKDTFNNLNDGSVKFGQSLEVLMKNGSTFGHSINQSIEQTGDNVEDLKEDVEKSKSIIDRIFDSVVVRLAVAFYGIYTIIKGAISNFKTLITILKFLNDPVGTLSKAYKDLKDQIVPLIEKSKKIIDLVRIHRKEIAATLGISALWTAIVAEVGLIITSFVGMTAGQFLLLAGVTTLAILVVTGQFEKMGKALDSIYNNYLLPFFENSGQKAEELIDGIEDAGTAIKNLDSVQGGPFPKSDFEADAALTFHKTLGISENDFGLTNLESAARSIATNMASGADSFSKINEELTQRGFLELFDGIKSGRPLFLDVLNADTVEEKKTVARKLSEQLQYISADREKAEREEIQKTVQTAKEAGAEQISVSQNVANNQSEFSKSSTEEVKNNLGEVKKEIEKLPAVDFKEVLPGITVPIEKTKEEVEELGQTFEKTSNTAQRSLDELGVFAADIAAEINNTFADLIFRGLKGNLDSLSEFWDATFDAMLNTFAQFAATVISNPIRIALDAVLRGESGSGEEGGGGKGFFGTLGGVFDIGKWFKTIGEGLSKIPGVSSIVDSITGLFAEGGALAGIGQFFSSALPVVGAIASVVAFAVPLISGLLKKTPRLDIDFDSVKTELGRRAALVEEFLDPEFFMENIGQVSVKRGGVGVGAGGSNQILELIRERIEETIEGIQDIIAKLPTDLFNQLNETLLNAEIDIDTVIAGERLLEFDAKGKKIAEKFQQFIEGELPAKFFAAIRESFFEPAFLALGVSAEGTEGLIDKFMADMEAAGSREARAEVGAEFIATFNAFVDAFNIVSGNVNDSIGQTIQTEEWEYRLAA